MFLQRISSVGNECGVVGRWFRIKGFIVFDLIQTFKNTLYET